MDNQFLSIEGKLTGGASMCKNGLELAGFLKTANSEKSSIIVLPIDRFGIVAQKDLFFYDTAKLFLGYNDKNRVFDPSSFLISNGLLQVNVRSGVSDAMAGFPYLPDSLVLQNNIRYNTAFLQVLAKQYKSAHKLENVTVTAKAKTKEHPGVKFWLSKWCDGEIAVYTKRGVDVTYSTDSKMGAVKLNNYSAIIKFYAYDYSKSTPDDYYDNLGVTLYWDPMIWLGDNQKRKTIRFYNNDVSKRFRIVLEGINEEGRLVHIEKVI